MLLQTLPCSTCRFFALLFVHVFPNLSGVQVWSSAFEASCLLLDVSGSNDAAWRDVLGHYVAVGLSRDQPALC